MFTGIIQTTSIITKIAPTSGGLLLHVDLPRRWRVKAGDSISVNGICSTAKRVAAAVQFEYMPETLERTNLKTWKKGDVVNLEQSLTAQSRLDGHLVLGHVDEVGTVKQKRQEGNSVVLTIAVSATGARLVAEKGSVAIDGISLTVVDVKKNSFTVKIIPYTLQNSNLHSVHAGGTVNVEFDILAKYIARLLPGKP